MKTRYMILSLLLVILANGSALAGTLSPALEVRMEGMADDAELKVLVVMADQVDVLALDRSLHGAKTGLNDRHYQVVTQLKDKASVTQSGLLAELGRKSMAGVRGYTPHWLINSVVVVADVATIREIAARPDVDVVEPDVKVTIEDPVDIKVLTDASPPSQSVATGVGSIRAHEVWYSLGFDGTGTIVGGLDTGVDLMHPALTNSWLARDPDVLNSEAWFIPGEFGDPKGPTDEHGHGTHTMGTMVGVTATDTTGVAPGARWIASNAVYNYTNVFESGILAALEFFADPDGDPSTSDDVPDVVNNSWGIETPSSDLNMLPCDSRWWAAVDNCEAAGIVMVWGAGNEGPDGGTLRVPADRASTATNCFSVGSVTKEPPFEMSVFSSRGPSLCGGPHEIKPEVSAPGSNIRSTWPGGSYAYLSGTSMAAPHVAGTVALMRQANPDADVITIKETLMATARDIMAPGEDNDSGWGVIDAYEAVLAIMPHTGTVSGVITDGGTGLPLEGAVVARVGGLESHLTGPDGSFSFFLPSGDHDFTVKKFGYGDGMIQVTILDDQVVIGDLTLQPSPPATVSGIVTGPEGEFVVGAEIRPTDTPLATVYSDSLGAYSITVPTHGTVPYRFWVTADGLGFRVEDILVTTDVTVDFQLPIDTTEDFESNHLYDYPWYFTAQGMPLDWITTPQPFEGYYSARAAATPDLFTSGMAIDYDVLEAGEISFWYRVSSEEHYDFFKFYVDDVLQGSWSGETGWTYFSVPVSAGLHTFLWEYSKDGGYFDGDDTVYIDFVTFPIPVIPPAPTVSVNVPSIETVVNPDGNAATEVTVFNSGAAALDFDARVLVADGAKAWGVGDFGYTWSDSDEPDGPVYDWIDISADGVDAGVGDDALLGPFALGFTMPFYGADYDSVYIGTNGFLSFTGDTHDYRNGVIPDPEIPNGFLPFFWDDMRSNQGGAIYYRAEPDSGRFIMQYQDVIRYQTATPHTIQVILRENGDITYQYADVTEPQSATVGIENQDGTEAIQVAYNDPDYLVNGLAIHFDYPGEVDWATVTPDTGMVPPGTGMPVMVDFDPTGLVDGVYHADLGLFTNDPVTPLFKVPVTLTVSSLSGVDDTPMARELVFLGAVPNPFNPATNLKFSLPRDAQVSLRVYDMAGRVVRTLVNEQMSSGVHEAHWNGRDEGGRSVASGVFFARLTVDGQDLVSRMTLLR